MTGLHCFKFHLHSLFQLIKPLPAHRLFQFLNEVMAASFQIQSQIEEANDGVSGFVFQRESRIRHRHPTAPAMDPAESGDAPGAMAGAAMSEMQEGFLATEASQQRVESDSRIAATGERTQSQAPDVERFAAFELLAIERPLAPDRILAPDIDEVGPARGQRIVPTGALQQIGAATVGLVHGR